MRLKYGMLLALLLTALAVTGLSLAPRARSEESAAEEAPVEAAVPPGAVELPDKRTATSDTFRLHSGMLETRIYGTPVNYEDPEGEWQPIEEGLEEGEGGEIVNGANSVEVSLPSELQEGLARVAIGDQWIGSRLLATETEPAQLSEGAAVYESPAAKTSFEYTTLPDGLKEEIELEGPSSPSSFRYELTASAGLSAELAADGSVVFKDAQGKAVASLPAPTVADAHSVVPNPEQVSYQLAPREHGAWVLTVSVDPEWLEAPGRSWPIDIDPTITVSEKSDLDCVIGGKTGQEGWIDCSGWGRQNLLAGYNAELSQAEDNWYHTLMYMSTAQIPKGAEVQAASLELHSPEAAQNTAGVELREVTKPWSWTANWRQYDTGKLWEREGGDYDSNVVLGQVKTAERGSAAGWWSIPVPAATVQQKANNEQDLSFLVKLIDDKVRSCTANSCTHRLAKFDSAAATTTANRPFLRVLLSTEPAPQTTITTPQPTYTEHASEPIQFSSSKPGSTFKCSFVAGTAASTSYTPCSSPYSLPDQLTGWHTFAVVATDANGDTDYTPATWTFNTGIYPPAPTSSKITSPEAGKKTGSYFTLQAAWSAEASGGLTGVRFQMKLPEWKAFEDVPAECVVNKEGGQVTWPLPAQNTAQHSEPVFLGVRNCPVFAGAGFPEKNIQFRAVFDGSVSAAGASEPVTTEFLRKRNASRVPTDATGTIGPASLDLVTGAFTVSRTDVSIPVPGTETTLEFTRTYDSTIGNDLNDYSFILGGAWQPSSPLESEYEGEAWTELKEQVIPATEPVYEKECWDPKTGATAACGTGCPAESCEEWLAEEAQPEMRWMELIDNSGAGIPFEISGTSYVAPDYAKELQLTRVDAEHITLSDPSGTHTTFTQKAPGEYLPKTISFQASPDAARMVYELVGGFEHLRLIREIAAAPGDKCEDTTSISEPGCRTLAFEYLSSNTWSRSTFPSSYVNLASIRYYNPSGNTATSQKVAEYNYNGEVQLIEEWDPRVSPFLKEKYSYEIDTGGVETNNLKTLTPPGQEPWSFQYYVNRPGQPLKSVSRATLQSSPAQATTTIAYEVPLSGEHAPYDMSPATVARWGQTDFPVDATAVFPPSQVPDIENFGFRSSFGSPGSGAGQLAGPGRAAIGPEGHIWVADTENNRIVQFDAEGKYVSSFGSLGSANGQLNHPRGLAFDPEGNIWVADTGNNRIEKFSPEGTYLAKSGSLGSEPGQFNQPSGIAILENGYLFVSDTGNNRVQQLQSSGAYVASVTGLSGPTGIAPRGHVVLVADTGNNRIATITPGFSTPTQYIGSQGSGEGQMNHPEGVGSDGLGHYWVADTGNNRIEEFTMKGVFVGAFGSSGSGAGQLSGPAGLAAVDNDGNLYVTDSGNGRIEEWNSTTPPISDYSQATVHYMDPDGHQVNTAAGAPPGVAGSAIATSETDAHGNVVRTLSARNRLLALAAGSSSATRSHELDSHSTYSADGIEMLESWGPLHSVRLESGETKEARAHTVVKYEDPTPPTGQPPYYLPTEETTGALQANGTETDQRTTKTEYNWNLRKPKATIVDPGEGHLAIKSVTVYDENTGLPVETSQPSNSNGGGAGTTKYVYYSAAAGSDECQGHPIYSGRLCRIIPAAQASGTGRPQLLVKKFKLYNNLDEPEEIVESPGGGTENIRKTLLTYDSAGRQKTKKIEGGGQAIPKVETEYSSTLGMPIAERFKCESECEAPQFLTSIGYASQSHTALKSPSDVAVDAAGNIWAVDKNNNRIVEYNEAGEYIREAGGLGSSGGKLSSPSGIAIDSGGNIDVTDTANNRVAQFSSTGAFIEVIGTNVNKTKVEAGGTTLEKNRCTAASGNVCQAGTAGSGEGQISEPIGITTTGGTNFFVVERANNRVEKFSPQAERLAQFGELGSGNGQLKEPAGIAFHGFLLWVADTGNNRMEAFTTSYVYSRQFGTLGSGNGQLSKPVGVDADESGNVWVAEQGNNRVQKFSETGTYLLKFGSPGTEEGKFNFSVPAGLALDGKGNVLVADPGNNRVQKWSTSGFDSQETKTSYDALGRPVTYEDADGNKAETTFDLDGRPVKATDAKGSQTVRYDAASGLPIELEDSAAGVFTASYNADGSLVKRGLPDGLTAETTYDTAGEPMHLSYTKASNCGANCLWLDFGLQRSISGQIREETGTPGTHHFSYDKDGRLTYANETPPGGQCTVRAYAYDADSNRFLKTTRSPGIGGICVESGGTTQEYHYDGADRLEGPTYDSWGRITSLPAEFAGGKTLTTGYFSNDMVAVQSQNGVSNMFQLDASLRQRQRMQGGGLEGTEVFHYDAGSDSPAWMQRGATWTRNIGGLGGELAAVQESGKEITLQLTNLHGDVSATAAISPEATSLKGTFSFDEFGDPTAGSAGRYGWLGGKQRRTELQTGVIQMGVRSYIPALGRFLSLDPVVGGSANAYDYSNQDPMNQFDITGCAPGEPIHRCVVHCLKSHCGGHNYAKVQHCLAQFHSVRDLLTCFSKFCDIVPVAQCIAGCPKTPKPPTPPSPKPPKPAPEPPVIPVPVPVPEPIPIPFPV